MSEQDQSERIIRLATRIMEAGEARGWSDALRQATEYVRGTSKKHRKQGG